MNEAMRNDDKYVTPNACARIHDELERRRGTQHQELINRLNSIDTKQDTIYARLFIDNGKKSIQTRLNEHERFISIQLWIIGIIGTSLLLSLIAGVFGIFRHVFMGG